MKRAVNKLFPATKPGKLWSSLKMELSSTIDEFYITLDHPHRTWYPNDKVSGTIILRLNKNMTDISIALSLTGHIKIKPHLVNASRKISLFNHTIQIYGDSASNGLTRGEHRFPFVVKLPAKNLYTSVDFVKGAIAYNLRATVKRIATARAPAGASNTTPVNTSETEPLLVCERSLTIVQPVNVSALSPPQAKSIVVNPNPMRKLRRTLSLTATIHLNGSGAVSDTSPLRLFIKIDLLTSARGYLRGEVIPVTLTIHHPKTRDESLAPIPHSNTGVIITLVRICRLSFAPEASALGLSREAPSAATLPLSRETALSVADLTFRKDLTQAILPLYVDDAPQTVLRANLRVPADAFPSINAPGVTFDYLVECCVNLVGKKLVPDRESLVDGGDPSGTLGGSPAADSFSMILNTDHLRRVKGVVRVCCAVVVGTERTAHHGKRHTQEVASLLETLPPLPLADGISSSPQSPGLPVTSPPTVRETPEAPHYSQIPPSPLPGFSVAAFEAPYSVPPPPLGGLSEKAYLQRQEQSLMPSQPPVEIVGVPAPSAPSLGLSQPFSDPMDVGRLSMPLTPNFSPNLLHAPLVDSAPLPLSGLTPFAVPVELGSRWAPSQGDSNPAGPGAAPSSLVNGTGSLQTAVSSRSLVRGHCSPLLPSARSASPCSPGIGPARTSNVRFNMEMEGDGDMADSGEGMDYVPTYEETGSPAPAPILQVLK